jgi:hypothetical protein
MKTEQTECSETLAYKIEAPVNYPEESIQQEEIYLPNTKHYGGRTERFNTALTIASRAK